MLKKYKVYINYILWLLGIRDVLPRDIIRGVIEKENNDPLVDIALDGTLFFDEELKVRPKVLLRKEVYNKLKQAQTALPSGICFKIYSAYRPIEEQTEAWNRRIEETKSLYPNIKDSDEIVRLTGLKIANPTDGYGGHQTGAAVDITLCDKDGNDLDMGCGVAEHNNKTKTKSIYLSQIEKSNREILFNVLEKVGFKNYPAEWWHYSYGDKMWAAYSRKRICFYGLYKG